MIAITNRKFYTILLKVPNAASFYCEVELQGYIITFIQFECVQVTPSQLRKNFPHCFNIFKGPDWTLSLHGHDKLCGYQKATFPLCIYGGMDTYSGRIHFLRIWTSNNNPKIIGRYYLEYLYELRGGFS